MTPDTNRPALGARSRQSPWDEQPILAGLNGRASSQSKMEIKQILAFAIKSDIAGGKLVTHPGAARLALVNTIGALAAFVAPNYRLWADVMFGFGAQTLSAWPNADARRHHDRG